MKKVIKKYWLELNTHRENIPHIKIWWMRIVLIPFMGLWFFLQLFLFSMVMGSFSFSIGILFLLSTIFEKPGGRDISFPLEMIVLPFVGPVIWLYKYTVLGEYNMIIEM